MSNSTTFVDKQTVITAAWANDVNTAVWSGTAPAGQVAGVEKFVASISLLRTVSKTEATSVQVGGYYVVADGGGGTYTLVATSQGSYVDNGGTIIVATDGGVWQLQHFGVLSAKQFGAKADGFTDDSASINALLTACGSVYTAYLPGGIYSVGSPIVIDQQKVMGDGRYNTTLRSRVSMSYVAQVTGEATINGIGFNGNSLAIDSVQLSGANGSKFTDCTFDKAIRNGVDGTTSSANNNHVHFTDCAGRNNGTVYPLTVSFTSGSTQITVTSGSVPVSLARPGDLLVITGVSPAPLIVDPNRSGGVTSSNIAVAFAPTSSGTGISASYIIGSGIDQTRAPNNNIWQLDNYYGVSNALAGLAIRSLYGITGSNLQLDSNYFGLVIGNRGVGVSNYPAGETVISGLYMESNTGPAQYAVMQQQSFTIIEPNYDISISPWFADTVGYSNFQVIKGGTRYKSFSGTLKSADVLYSSQINSNGGIAAGSTYTASVTTSYDCTNDNVIFVLSGWGGGENSQDPSAVGVWISNQTTTGFTINIKNKGTAGQTLHGAIRVYQNK